MLFGLLAGVLLLAGCAGIGTPTPTGVQQLSAPTEEPLADGLNRQGTPVLQKGQPTPPITQTPQPSGAASGPSGQPAPSGPGSSGQLVESPLAPSSSGQPNSDQATALARQDLASRLNISADAIEVLKVEAVDWPDSSLGCPQPGQMYAQIVTPGFRVTLAAQGQEYDYHTDGGRRAVLCQR
ncbi:MAG: hypothetical protein HYX89_06935 [Chloroflexi bacterium]|nr:hypothetical protein [Chloroflexota bacterium]